MYLKRLEFHGFKSFAQRTVLEFSSGITAIVGPNGSGKSNIADGIRWVLGEQSMRQLRGKKSDDVIFAGGHGRATMQMAEVSLVLDNTSAWLPSEFSEVTISRRNFRSGDMEYLINGQRVRLRDVLMLLAQAHIGHDSYTVIGQGQVEQALSVRPEERRSLFEDAAGIRQFQAQRIEAEQKLALTQNNLSRLHDIISEIEPRLGPLAEQARRARDFVGTRDELLRLLRIWYRQQWRDVQLDLQQAERNERDFAQHMHKLQEALAVEDALIQELRQKREQLLGDVAQLRRERGEGANRQQVLERDLAVARERLTSISRQVDDLSSERQDQQDAIDTGLAHMGAIEAQIEAAEAEARHAADILGAIESGLHGARQEQEREEARLRAAQRDVIEGQARVGAAQAELARLQKQRADRSQALAARQDAVAQSADHLETLHRQLDERRNALDAARERVEELVAEREELVAGSTSAQVELDDLRMSLADLARERKALQERMALLQEWRASLKGVGEGVSALLMADGAKLAIRGIVAQMVTTAEGLELAIESALGPLLYAGVVESEAEAVSAAEWLAEHGGGAAHFIWLDGHHAGNDGDGLPAADGVNHLGRAADHIEAEPRLRDALARVLANTYVVRDVATAEVLISRYRPAASIVTLAGDMWNPVGWLKAAASSASKQEESSGTSTLGRERQLQELPQHIDQVDRTIAELGARQRDALARQQQRKEDIEQLRKLIQRAEAETQDLVRVTTALQREQERAAGDAQVSERLLSQLAAELTGLDDDIEATRARLAQEELARREAQEQVEDVQAALDDVLERNRGQQESLAQARTNHALKTQEVRALTQRLQQLKTQVQELEAQLRRKDERLASLTYQREEITSGINTQEAELETLRVSVRELSEALRERDVRQGELERQALDLERGQSQERQELARLEVEYRRSLLEAQRARDAIETLSQQIRDDLGASGEDDPLQTIINIVEAEEAENLPRLAAEDATRMRRQIEQLRGRLRHLGGFDPEAPQAYEELRHRHEFLTGQVQDMEEATRNLRSVIAELDVIMKRRFEETFEIVNERFQRHFITMFSGGHARLELTAPRRSAADDEDDDIEPVAPARTVGMGGVEVFVQIPGKRVQDLSLLSGGERSMVSAALLFALLETNPPPFCLLDEVDAALDEANVVRFCEILTVLAERTQFVVITHNRVTMTHANAIYGVSMREDSVSRVLSMKLAEVPVR